MRQGRGSVSYPSIPVFLCFCTFVDCAVTLLCAPVFQKAACDFADRLCACVRQALCPPSGEPPMHNIIQYSFVMQCNSITQSLTTPHTAWSSPVALCLVAIYLVVPAAPCRWTNVVQQAMSTCLCLCSKSVGCRVGLVPKGAWGCPQADPGQPVTPVSCSLHGAQCKGLNQGLY